MRLSGVLAAAAVFIAGLTGLWVATDGFAAFTAESARRLAVQQNPRAVPAAALEDQDGRPFSLADYGGRPVLVEFIFTRCADICIEFGDAFETVAADLERERRGSEVALLSISFDAADTLEDLSDYGARFRADGRRWRIARPTSPESRARLLAAFGVTVIPDAFGGFEHNAAVHLLDRQGRITRIMDHSPPAAVVSELWNWL